MKRYLILLAISVLALSVDAQIRWPFGNYNSITGGSNDTIDISSELERGLNYYDISNDTNVWINVTTTSDVWKTGDFLFIEATEATGDADTLNYGTNITGLLDAIPSGKTRIVQFIWNGTAWVKVSSVQID